MLRNGPADDKSLFICILFTIGHSLFDMKLYTNGNLIPRDYACSEFASTCVAVRLRITTNCYACSPACSRLRRLAATHVTVAPIVLILIHIYI